MRRLSQVSSAQRIWLKVPWIDLKKAPRSSLRASSVNPSAAAIKLRFCQAL